MITIKHLTKTFRNNGLAKPIFEDVGFEIKTGEFVAVFGPNGCGKTTLLNIIASLEKPSHGEIIKPENLKIGYIFQNFKEVLFPWLRVIDNIAFPLKLKGVGRTERSQKVEKLLSNLQINLNLKAFPYQLSAGQQQLTAMLRGIIEPVDLLILDEPFSSLDYLTTFQMEQTLLKLWEKFKFSVLFVTHAAGEAVLLADRVLIMKDQNQKPIKSLSIPLPRPRLPEIITEANFNQLKKQVINACFGNNSKI